MNTWQKWNKLHRIKIVCLCGTSKRWRRWLEHKFCNHMVTMTLKASYSRLFFPDLFVKLAFFKIPKLSAKLNPAILPIIPVLRLMTSFAQFYSTVIIVRSFITIMLFVAVCRPLPSYVMFLRRLDLRVIYVKFTHFLNKCILTYYFWTRIHDVTTLNFSHAA